MCRDGKSLCAHPSKCRGRGGGVLVAARRSGGVPGEGGRKKEEIGG